MIYNIYLKSCTAQNGRINLIPCVTAVMPDNTVTVRLGNKETGLSKATFFFEFTETSPFKITEIKA